MAVQAGPCLQWPQVPAPGGPQLPTQLDAPLFAGLSGCTRLVRLEIAGGEEQAWEQRIEWHLGNELSSHPDQLRQWLPHVRELVCSAKTNLLPLVHGLAPNLRQLRLVPGPGVIASKFGPAQLAGSLDTCHKLQKLSLPCITQAILDALVSLPELTHVEARGLWAIRQPHSISSGSDWEELIVGELGSEVKWEQLNDLAMLPLASIQRLVLRSLLVIENHYPLLGSGHEVASQRAGQQQVMAAVARVPDLLWAGALVFVICPSIGYNLDIDGDDGENDDVLANLLAAGAPAVSAQLMQHFHATIRDSAPLAARG